MTSSFYLTVEMLGLVLQERLKSSPWGAHVRVTKHLLLPTWAVAGQTAVNIAF